jgi:hypothetical protein
MEANSKQNKLSIKSLVNAIENMNKIAILLFKIDF